MKSRILNGLLSSAARTALVLLVFVIVEGFPEADPDVEQSQATAQATKKAVGDQRAKPGNESRR